MIAGPTAMAYRTFVRMVLYFAELGGRPIVSLPGWTLMALSHLTRHIRRLPQIDRVKRATTLERAPFSPRNCARPPLKFSMVPLVAE